MAVSRLVVSKRKPIVALESSGISLKTDVRKSIHFNQFLNANETLKMKWIIGKATLLVNYFISSQRLEIAQGLSTSLTHLHMKEGHNVHFHRYFECISKLRKKECLHL